jgi:hypothetical protein
MVGVNDSLSCRWLHRLSMACDPTWSCCSRYLLFTFLTQCYFTMYGEYHLQLS